MDKENPKAQITNNLGIDLDIYDVYNHSGDPKGKFTYTKLGVVKAGATQEIQTIHSASQLQAMYTGKNDKLNSKYFYQFPMAVMGISTLNKETAYTITEDDRSGTEQAFNFIKYTTANPASKLTKAFVAKVSEKKQKEAVDAFFAATASFKQCTLVKWAAVAAWLTQFSSGWQGPYYLYAQQQEAGGRTKVVAVAIVVVRSDEQYNDAVIIISNSNGAIGPNSQYQKLAMVGDGSMAEENVGTGDFSVSLTPVWMNVIQTGDDNTTKYLIGSALAGTVNGINVVGTQQSRTLPDSKCQGMTDAECQAAKQESEREFDRTFSKVFTILGFLVGLGTMVVMMRQMQGHAQQRNDVENKAVEKNPDATKDDIKDAQEKLDENQIDDEVALELNTRETKISDELPKLNQDLKETIQRGRTEDLVDRQVDALQEVLETQAPTDKIESTAQDLSDVQQQIKDGKFDGVDAKVEKIGADIKQDLQEGAEKLQEYEVDALTEVETDIKETKAENDAIERAAEENEKLEGQDPDGEVPDKTYEEPESDPLPFEFAGE